MFIVCPHGSCPNGCEPCSEYDHVIINCGVSITSHYTLDPMSTNGRKGLFPRRRGPLPGAGHSSHCVVADLLSSIPSFAHVEAQTLPAIAGSALQRKYAVDQVVLLEGEPSSGPFNVKRSKLIMDSWQ